LNILFSNSLKLFFSFPVVIKLNLFEISSYR
jgi:hypothetical protein